MLYGNAQTHSVLLLQTRKQQVSAYNPNFAACSVRDLWLVHPRAGPGLNGTKGKSSFCSTLSCLHYDTNEKNGCVEIL